MDADLEPVRLIGGPFDGRVFELAKSDNELIGVWTEQSLIPGYSTTLNWTYTRTEARDDHGRPVFRGAHVIERKTPAEGADDGR